MRVVECRKIHTARFIKDLTGWSGEAKLYELNPPLAEASFQQDVPNAYRYVVVSSTVAIITGPETYIFGSDEEGGNVNFCELPGSFRGDLDHKQALHGAGYEIIY